MTSALRRLFLVATPLALAVVLWFHPPGGEPDAVYEGVRHDVGAWLFVHTGFLLFTPLMAFAVFLLLNGLQSRAATVSRVALVFFLVFYTAYEVTVGLGTGILTEYANDLPAAEQAAVADAIQHLMATTSSAIRCRSRSSSGCWHGWSRWWRQRSHSGAPEPAGW